MNKGRRIEMQDAGENIFADLGRPGAAEHYVKAQLVFQIQQIMKARALTQRTGSADGNQAARCLEHALWPLPELLA